MGKCISTPTKISENKGLEGVYAEFVKLRNERLLSVQEIKSGPEKTMLSFVSAQRTQGPELFRLVGDAEGVKPIAVNSEPLTLNQYNFVFNGQFKIDPGARFLQVKLVNPGDNRGPIYAINYRGQERENEIYNANSGNPNFFKGGHYHKSPAKVAAPMGTIDLHTGNIDENIMERPPLVQIEGTVIDLPANTSHIATSKVPFLLAEYFASGRYEATNDKNREVVNSLNAKQTQLEKEALVIEHPS